MTAQAYFSICPLPSELVDSSDDDFDCSKEGLKYIAGYLAHKFRIKYPDLGTRTDAAASFKNHSESKWITALSRGGLMLPSHEFLSKMIQFEKIFKEVHGNGLNTQYKVMQTTIEHILQSFPDFPLEIIKKYVRTRTFIRIKELNNKIRKTKEANRKRNVKKVKHFTA